MLALTAPRIKAAMAYDDRQLELDAAVFRRSNGAVSRALRDGRQLTRAELAQVFAGPASTLRDPSASAIC